MDMYLVRGKGMELSSLRWDKNLAEKNKLLIYIIKIHRVVKILF